MSLINDVISNNVDLFITGDVKYHEALDAWSNKISIVDLGHFNSEFIFTELMANFLQKEMGLHTHIFHQKDIFKFI